MQINSSVSSLKQLQNRVSESDNSKVNKWTLMNNIGKSVFAQICKSKAYKNEQKDSFSP